MKERDYITNNYLPQGFQFDPADYLPLTFARAREGNRVSLQNLPSSVNDTIDTPLFNNITISDDQSAGSKITERNLAVLRGGKKGSEEPTSRARTRGWSYRRRSSVHEYVRLQHMDVATFAAPIGMGHDTVQGVSSSRNEPRSDVKKEDLASVGLDHVLDGSSVAQLDPAKLQRYVELLHLRIQQLETGRKDPRPPRFQILNRIIERKPIESESLIKTETTLSVPYFDKPEWIPGQGEERQLHGTLPVHNFDLFLEKNKDISFIVYHDFDPASPSNPDAGTANKGGSGTGFLYPQPLNETIQPVSEVLIGAVKTILGAREEYSSILRNFRSSLELQAPYLFIYHSRKELDTIQEHLNSEACKEVSLLLDFVQLQYGDRYAAADDLFQRRKITSDYIRYLFKPGDVLLRQEDGRFEAFIATGWPVMSAKQDVPGFHDGGQSTLYGPQLGLRQVTHGKHTLLRWEVSGWHWAFDGKFQRQHGRYDFEIEVDGIGKGSAPASSMAWQNQVMEEPRSNERNITGLKVFPLEYADPGLVESLRKRGSTFWKCRNRRLVSYLQDDQYSAQNTVSLRR